MKKIYPDAASALDGVLQDGMLIASGGFGLYGITNPDVVGVVEGGLRIVECAEGVTEEELSAATLVTVV